MAQPTSFRLPEKLLERLDGQASASGMSTTALVAAILEEGLNTRSFPGVMYRDGPTGRRAALVGGPDLWEVIRDVSHGTGAGETRLRSVAERGGLSVSEVRLAVDFYTEHPEDIDRRIEDDRREAERIRELIERREQILSS